VDYIMKVEDFEPYIGSEAIARIQEKARALQDIQVVNFNSNVGRTNAAQTLAMMSRIGWDYDTFRPEVAPLFRPTIATRAFAKAPDRDK
jgi:hypothetical protein